MVHSNSAGLEKRGVTPRQTFTKADRLRKRSEFLTLTKLGQRFQNQYFIAYVQRNHENRCRLGITVTRRVGKAAKRNRIKRLAREYFRQHRDIFKDHWDISLIAKREVADIPNKEIFLSLEGLFARLAANTKG